MRARGDRLTNPIWIACCIDTSADGIGRALPNRPVAFPNRPAACTTRAAGFDPAGPCEAGAAVDAGVLYPSPRLRRVGLPLARSLVEHAERAVLARNQLDPVSGAFVEVGDVGRGKIGITGITGRV